KVDSAVLRLDLRKDKPVELIDEELFFEVIKGGFGQRRKTLHNALTGVRGLAKDRVAEVLAEAGIEANRRAETLSIEEFARIANIIARG
ncbi:MAG: 16S rRNA (adenine(1518)-N(6)/adenine(1519)-N(6))-dimethyltransferase, partial [Firmicutes bacterium]|nr:16S rRNA (adenine(1518)-N(6)/adenine(1519)-N(6))-dimethyltransferase [Bacillota bacterium]